MAVECSRRLVQRMRNSADQINHKSTQKWDVSSLLVFLSKCRESCALLQARSRIVNATSRSGSSELVAERAIHWFRFKTETNCRCIPLQNSNKADVTSPTCRYRHALTDTQRYYRPPDRTLLGLQSAANHGSTYSGCAYSQVTLRSEPDGTRGIEICIPPAFDHRMQVECEKS